MLLWASAFVGIRAGLHAYSPAHLALLRYAAASLTLGGYALVKHMCLPPWRDLLRMALLGLVGIAFYGVALNAGEVSVPSAVASFLVNAAPIFIALEARVWLGELPSVSALLGGALVLVGVMVVNARGHRFAEASSQRFIAERLQASRRPWHAHLSRAGARVGSGGCDQRAEAKPDQPSRPS